MASTRTSLSIELPIQIA